MSLDCLRKSAQFSQEAKDAIKDIHTNVVKMSVHFVLFFLCVKISVVKMKIELSFV